MIEYTRDLRGAFVATEDLELREIINEVVANFHMRDGAAHPDGSRGSIKISPDQLRDCLAYMATRMPPTALDIDLRDPMNALYPDWEWHDVSSICSPPWVRRFARGRRRAG